MPAKFTLATRSVTRLRFLTIAFITSFSLSLVSPTLAQEVDLKLPAPSKIKAISKPFSPAIIRAVTVNPKDPFLFDFVIDKGDSNLSDEAFEAETQKLVKYFLAALTIPENDLWVNLSPYEQDAMVPQVLGVTELGKDLLVEDYYLKQVTAQLTNPNTDTGKKFWTLAYAKAQELYGTTQVPINTFSKVWIVPDHATVLEKDGSAFIAESHLKVFLDQDYLAIKKNLDNKEIGTDKIGADKAQNINGFSADIIRQVVLPEIEKEINTGENFAAVRQIYSSAILAAWYKKRLKESLLGKLYADQNKVAGVNAQDMDSGDKIFEKYTAALKTGAYNIIKQDYDLSTQKVVQRKYFSGGVKLIDKNVYKPWTPETVSTLSPAASEAVSRASSAVKRYFDDSKAGKAASSTIVIAHVRVAAASSAIVSNVGSRLFSLRGVEINRVEQDGFYAMLNGAPTAAPIVNPAAVNVLANMSADAVKKYAADNSLDLKSVAALHEAIQKKLEGVAPAGRSAIINNFVAPTNVVVSPIILGHLAQQNTSLTTLKKVDQVAGMKRADFDAMITTLTPKVAPEVVQNLQSVRAATEKLAPNQTVFAVAANNVDLSVVSSPEVSAAIAAAAKTPAPVLPQSAQSSLAFAVATSSDAISLGMALNKAGATPAQVQQAQNERERLATAGSVFEYKNIATPVLSTFTAQSSDIILNSAGFGTGAAPAALMRVAATDNNTLTRQLDGISPAIKEKIAFAKPQLDLILKANTNDATKTVNAVGFMDAVRANPGLNSLAQTFNSNPVLVQSIVNEPGVTATVSDTLADQVAAAQKIVNVDTTDAKNDDYKGLREQMRNAGIPAENQGYIALREIPAVKVAMARDQNLPFLVAVQKYAPTLTNVISNPKYSSFVSQYAPKNTALAASSAVSDNLLTSHSRAAALINTADVTSLTSTLTDIFRSESASPLAKTVTKEEIPVIAAVLKEIAAKPEDLSAQFRGQTIANKIEGLKTSAGEVITAKRAADLAGIVSEGKQFNQLAAAVDRKGSTLSALSTVNEETLSRALTAAGESPSVAREYVAFQTAKPELAKLGTTGLVQGGQENIAEVLSRASAKPEFQAIIASDTTAIASVSPEAVDREARLDVVASRIYTAYNASTEKQQGNVNAALKRAPTPEAIRVWVAKASDIQKLSPAQRKAQAPELVALLTMPKVQQAFNATQAVRASSTVNYIQSVLASNVNEGTLTKSVEDSLPRAKFTPQERADVSGAFIAIKNAAAGNAELTAQIAVLKDVSGLTALVSTNSALAGKLSPAQTAAIGKLQDKDVQKLGGIDLSAERMDLNIKRDGNGVVMPISDQDISNLKIDGLAPVVLDVEAATPANVPFLMNLSNSSPAK